MQWMVRLRVLDVEAIVLMENGRQLAEVRSAF